MTYYDLITLSLSLLGINTVILWLTETSGDTSQRDVRHTGTRNTRHINHAACQASDYSQLLQRHLHLRCLVTNIIFAFHTSCTSTSTPTPPPWLCSRISVVFASVIFRSNKSRSRHGVHFTLHLDVTNLPRGSWRYHQTGSDRENCVTMDCSEHKVPRDYFSIWLDCGPIVSN